MIKESRYTVRKEMDIIKNIQVKLLELKTKITKMKHSLDSIY